MYEVLYFTRSGNTRKVAEAIADELGVAAREVKAVETLPEEAFIFLGTGCYGGTLPGDIARFMSRNRFHGRKVALFTTSCFGSAAERGLIEKQIRDKGADVTASFSCTGRWMTMKKDHPTPDELKNAREFARGVAAARKDEREKAVKAHPRPGRVPQTA